MLEWATSYFEEKNINSPRLSIEWLLSHVLECNRLDLYLAYDRPLTENDLQVLKPLLLRRANHEPLQYIVGSTNFFGLDLIVNPSVLIPRPETEQLVEIILADKPENAADVNVLDLGTGSGCIPVALKKYRPDWNLYATDISEESINVAKDNAKKHTLDITFTKHDFLKGTNPFPDVCFDIIISNPPYINTSEEDEIDLEVKKYEPAEALFHPDVSLVYRNIIKIASDCLKKDGKLFLEINEKLGGQILTLFKETEWISELKKDYGDKERFVFSVLKSV
jgi:release factor glutamine methyltransferase